MADAEFALGRIYAARGDNTAAESAFAKSSTESARGRCSRKWQELESIAGKPSEDAIRTAKKKRAERLHGAFVARLTLVRSLIAAGGATQLARAESELKKLEAGYPQVAAVHVQAGALALPRTIWPQLKRG